MTFDVAVIGAGPAGYVAAIRLGQLGMKVVLIERERVGGTCLNWGCIPTKSLFHATKLVERAAAGGEMGIRFAPPTVDVDALRSWVGGVVSGLCHGIETVLDAAGVVRVTGHGRLGVGGGVMIDGGERVEAKQVILATGSVPFEIPALPFSEPAVWSSNDAVALARIPERLVIVGAGVIGLEMASIYRRLGSEVVVLELADRLLPGVDMDRRLLAVLGRALDKEGIEVRLGDPAASFLATADGGAVTTQSGDSLQAEKVLVAVGRRPRTGDLGLDAAGVSVDRGGRIEVNERMETVVPGIYAIGDAVAGPMLAHKASAEAVALAERLGGDEGSGLLDHTLIPQAVFTDPEAASVGISEATARAQGLSTITGRFAYAALGKAQAMAEAEGMFQVVAEAGTRRLMGVQVVGSHASDLIGIAALALQTGCTVEDLAGSIQVHPTLPEGMKEAAEAALGKAIHAVNRPPRGRPQAPPA